MRTTKSSMLISVLLLAACGGDRSAPAARPVPPRPTATETATGFAKKASEAFRARDAQKAGALFNEDAVLSLVGQPDGNRSGAAIEQQVAELFDRYRDAKLTIGRVWVGQEASVIEFVFGGTRSAGEMLGAQVPERPVGLVGASVVVFDEDGRVRTLRVYLDVATLVGQVEPALLPDGMKIRPVVTAVPAGTDVLTSQGTPDEARNLDVTNRIWAALEAHEVADVMAPASDDYVYEDFSGPGPLTKADTQQMVARFLAVVPDFAITAKPVQIAAGDDVVTEMVEQATFDGKPVTLHALDVKRFESGKVVLEWQYANYVEALTQLHGWGATGQEVGGLSE
jgi:ketosteroid isomerase-like protein